MTALGKWRTIVVSLLALSTVAAVVALASLPLLRSSPVRADFTAPPSVTVVPQYGRRPGHVYYCCHFHPGSSRRLQLLHHLP
jgi:hypothetical protein